MKVQVNEAKVEIDDAIEAAVERILGSMPMGSVSQGPVCMTEVACPCGYHHQYRIDGNGHAVVRCSCGKAWKVTVEEYRQ